jgi:NitT/TauT family transport system permease protein
MRSTRGRVLFWQVAIVAGVLAVWQWGYDLRAVPALKPFVPSILDPYFVSKPSMIWTSFLKLSCLSDREGFAACFARNENNLWLALMVTLVNMWWGFLLGTASGVLAGLVLGRSDDLSRIFQPFVVAMNSIPRIALVPLIILMFGLGDMSKIVTAWIVVFFVVFFNTFEGTRSAEARANSSEMMVAIFAMMIVGIVLAAIVRRIQVYLLRWQPQFDAPA